MSQTGVFTGEHRDSELGGRILDSVSQLDQLLGRTLVLVAHPDDECIAFGAILQRMQEPHVLFATDGSPHDPFFWKSHGSRTQYAKLRQDEARSALLQVGVTNVDFLADTPGIGELFVDQRLFRVISQALEVLSTRVEQLRPTAIATLAYEGGHPDHDTCNFLAAALSHQFGIPTWEAPLYHRNSQDYSKGVVQEFIATNGTEEDLEITPQEIDRKRRMCNAYPSQGDFLRTFLLERETFRPIPSYDYSRPAHPGRLNYEVWQWEMTGPQVSAEFARYLQDKAA